jgi:signal transduction histidine kinase/CheY-like chemotaxis protein
MSVSDVLIELLFLLLFVSTLVTWLRRRDALSANVMLIFASVAMLFVLAALGQVFGTPPDFVVGIALAVLLAQPLLTLRLAAQLQTIPTAVLAAALLGYLVTTVPLIVLPLVAVGPVLVGAIFVFVVIEGVAAAYLALAARRRAGAARMRLGSAAVATALFAVALLLATGRAIVPAAGPGLADLGRLLGLVAAIGYVLAFLPPQWLRRLVRATSAFEFTQRLVEAPPDEPSGVWRELAQVAAEVTAAEGVLIVTAPPDGAVTVSAVAGRGFRDPAAASLLLRVPDGVIEEQPAMELEPAVRELASLSQTRFVSVIPFALGLSDRGAMLLFRSRRSLFAADDRSLLEQLVSRTAVFAERAEATARQQTLTTRLAATVGELERASQAKSDFLASMSHELRTPLSAIIGFSALMRDEELDGERRSVPDEWIQHIHRSGEHLLALINDVLDLTKIEAGRIDLQLEAFDLAGALAESVGGLRPLAERKQIQLNLDCDPGSIEADRGRIRQIVYNLLSNAIKFTPNGGSVSVEGRFDGDAARIVVADSGVGIAAEDHERVFEEFRQVGDMKAREAGTGLGLALSRRLAEAHGGRIELTSQLGAGSRFEVVLPGARAEATPDATFDGLAGEGSVGDVLVIEDDPGAVRLLRTYLEGDGYRVSVAADGQTGIATAIRERPQAIVLDLLLPGIDGWEVLRRLKADARVRDIPVVVVTVVDERGLTMSLGAVDYFLKPVDRDALLERLSCYTFTTKVKTRTVRILVVDDDPAARELAAQALRPEGFEVTAVASGREALEATRKTSFDLVICDLLMPDMDGFEVVNRLQADAATSDIPILILTAQVLTSDDRRRLRGKTAGIVEKGSDLRPALQAWLRRAAAAARKAASNSATRPSTFDRPTPTAARKATDLV